MALLVPIVQKYCSCTDEFYNPTPIGHLQREYETLRQTGKTAKEALNRMKVVRLCCRESIFNPPTLFMNSSNIGRVTNEVNQSKVDTPEILPKKPLPPV